MPRAPDEGAGLAGRKLAVGPHERHDRVIEDGDDARHVPVHSAENDLEGTEFLDAISARIDDDQIEIEQIMLFSAAASSSDTSLYSLLEASLRRHYPSAGIAPGVAAGFTDSHFFRDIGIDSYGYSPAVIPSEARSSVHGNNERIGVDAFNRGVEIMIETVSAFVTD